MHPLRQIADSPLHRLLLKQWLKEEELITLRVKSKERRIVTLHEETTALYFSFFAFNSIIVLLLLFTPSSTPTPCCLPWVPCLCSLACSMSIAWAISYKTDSRRHLKRLIEREKCYGVVLVRCIEELRKKGMEFDVMKEVGTLRRAKRGAKLEKERTSTSKKDPKMLFLYGVSCVVMGITWFKLCNSRLCGS